MYFKYLVATSESSNIIGIIGDITIADDIAIGANALVCKDFLTPGITIAGVPAKKISEKNSHQNLLLKV